MDKMLAFKRNKGKEARPKRPGKKGAKDGAQDLPPQPSEEEVNALFESTILPEFSIAGEDQKKQLLSLSAAVKWGMIVSRKAMHEESPPHVVVEEFNRLFAGGVVPDPDSVADLSITIRGGSKTWLQGFYEAGGLESIIQRLSDIHDRPQKTEKDLEVQTELLRCLKVSMNNSLGMEALMESPELVGALALNLDSMDAGICTLVLELLTVIMLSAAGHQVVLDAMSHFKKAKEENVRFLFLVNSLRSGDLPTTYKRDVILFINTLINSAASLEERILLRADLIYGGILGHIDTLKQAPLDGEMSDERYELEVQIEVFEAVMTKDNTEATTSSGDLDLSDAEQLFKAVHASAVETECGQQFMSVLQHLLVIPVIDRLGSKLWEAVERCVHHIVIKVDHDYELNYADVKGLLEAKEELEKYAREMKSRSDGYSKTGSESVMNESAPSRSSTGSVVSKTADGGAAVDKAVGDPRAALMGMLQSRGKAATGAVEETKLSPPVEPSTGDPKAALMAALSKRGGDSGAEKKVPSVPSDAPADPRAALMAHLAKRGGGGDSATADKPSAPSAEASAADPRAALMAHLAKRGGGDAGAGAAPADTPPPDPRAALNAALLKRGGGGGGGTPADSAAPADPRGALMAALATKGGGGGGDGAAATVASAPPSAPGKRKLPPGIGEPATAPDPNAPKPPPLPGMPDEPEAPTAQWTGGPPVIKDGPKGLPPGLGQPAMKPDPNAPPPPPLPGTESAAPAACNYATGPPVIKPRTTPLPKPPGIGESAMKPDPDAPLPPPLPGTAGAAGPPRPGGAVNPLATGGGGAAGGGGVPGKPKKASVKPPVAMKNLFWTKIPEGKIQSTVWKELDDEKIRLDVSELESMFCKVDKKKAEAATDKAAAKKNDKGKEVHVLDGKVLQNAGIAMAKYKMPPAEAVKSLLALDEKIFDFDGIKTLHTIAPTQEDITALKEYDGEVSALGKVEQFFLEVMKIPNYPQRLECWMYKLKFANQLKEMKEGLEVVSRAMEQVKGSKKFQTILEYVLALGNYLNGGTAQGGVYGVKLDVLLKLKTIKGSDGKVTLLDFLVKTCEKKSPDVLYFDQDFVDVEPSTRFSFSQWKSDFGGLKNGLKLITTTIENVRKNPPMPLDKFVETFEAFSKTMGAAIEALQKDSEAAEAKFVELTTFYGEDPTKCTPEEFFGLFNQFVGEFGRVRQEIEKRRLMDEKAAKRKAAQESGASADKGKGDDNDPASRTSNLVDDILGKIKNRNADDILSSLKTGKKDQRKLLTIVRKNSDEKQSAAKAGFVPQSVFKPSAGGLRPTRGVTIAKDQPASTPGAAEAERPVPPTDIKAARAAMSVVGTLSPKTLKAMREKQKMGGVGLGMSNGATSPSPPPPRTAAGFGGMQSLAHTMGAISESEDDEDGPPEPQTPTPLSSPPSRLGFDMGNSLGSTTIDSSMGPPPSPVPVDGGGGQPVSPAPAKKVSALERLRSASAKKVGESKACAAPGEVKK